MNIIRLSLRRLSRLILTLWIASTALFLLLRIIPGDPASVIAGLDAGSDPVVLEQIRSDLGLNDSLLKQYGDWTLATFTLNFGDSFQRQQPVRLLLMERLPLTVGLAINAMLISLLIAIPAGVIAAVKKGGAADTGIMSVSHILLAVPEFWLGILLLLVFSVAIPVFPLFGSSTAAHFVLPSLALGLGRAAFLSRLVRSAVVRELRKTYPEALEQLGVPRTRILVRHVLPNSLIPIAIPAAIQFGYLLGGAIIIEQVFGMGGTGRLLLQAIQTRDYPLIQGGVITLAIIFSLVNFLADILTVVADPRSRL